MGDNPRRLFQIWEDRTLPLDTWQRFIEKARQAGRTPASVLRELIEQYNARPTHDTEQTNRRNPPAAQ